MKTVDVSDEAYDRIMRDSKGAPFDAMLWMMIRDYESSKKVSGEMMGTLLASVISKDKDEFKKNMDLMKKDKREDWGT